MPGLTGIPNTVLENMREDACLLRDWLNDHGYTATAWRYATALNNYGPTSRRTEYAGGYAVRYAGQLVRDDGSRAEYPTAGVYLLCSDDHLPMGRVIDAGRALITFDNETYAPYYVAGWNARDTKLRREIAGRCQNVVLRTLTPTVGGDGPKRFFDLRMVAI
jgi:hypothetical protein